MALKPCRECKTEISSEADACPRCGAKTSKRKPGRLLAWLILAAVIYGAYAYDKNKAYEDRKAIALATRTERPPEAPPKAQTTGWVYSSQLDKMSGSNTMFATMTATTLLDLKSPYQGKNQANLIVRQSKTHGLSVLLVIDKGQLMCRNHSMCKIAAKFDDASPVTFEGGGAADHSTNVAFIQNPKKFVNLASKAKNITLSLAIFNNGNPLIEFQTLEPLAPSKLQ